MIELAELRKLQAQYEAKRMDFQKSISLYVKLREQFIHEFPKQDLNQMTLENYALGNDNYKETFTYWMDFVLAELGDIRGARSNKFGVYFGRMGKDKVNKYRVVNRFGTDEVEAFASVK